MHLILELKKKKSEKYGMETLHHVELSDRMILLVDVLNLEAMTNHIQYNELEWSSRCNIIQKCSNKNV